MTRGEVWWVDFGIPFGSEPGYRRPVIIIQADFLNNSRFQTVLAVPLTTNMLYAEAPGNVIITRAQSGLTKDSVAVTAQLYPADKSRFVELAGNVRGKVLKRIEEGIILTLGIDRETKG